MANQLNFLPAVDKCIGRENPSSWQFCVQAYMEHDGLTAAQSQENDAAKLTKAKTKLILLIKPINYANIQSCTAAHEIWNKFKLTFEESGLSRRVSLMRTLTSTKLENCTNTVDYVHLLMNMAHKLRGINCDVSKEWIGTFVLAGLPDVYKPMTIESSGVLTTLDSIRTKLLQDVKSVDVCISSKVKQSNSNKGSNSSIRQHNFIPSEPGSSQSRVQCFICNLYGHKAFNCPDRIKNKNEVSLNIAKSFFAGFSTGILDKNEWFIDSGASFHMSPRSDWITERSNSPIDEIMVANNSKLHVESAGTVYVESDKNGVGNKIPLNGVLYIPDLSSNLLSVSQLCQKGHTVIFKNQGCEIFDKDMDLVATGRHVNRLFMLNLSSTKKDSVLWHRRMGHLNIRDLTKLRTIAAGIDFISPNSVDPCIECLRGKQTRFLFPKNESRASALLEVIHSDLCGPMKGLSLGGARYFITFIDDYSRKAFIYLLETKTKIPEIFEHFKSLVENQLGRTIKVIQSRSSMIVANTSDNTINILRTDNGTEYVNQVLENFLKKSGIRFQTTTPYTPQQNVLAQRMNRTIVEKTRCMILDAKLTNNYWAEAISTAVYVTNRSPSSGLDGKTPEEVWSGKPLNLSDLKVFGCKATVHFINPNLKKWDSKSEEYIFVGYCLETKRYRLYHPVSKKLFKNRDVVFLENQMIDSIDSNNLLQAIQPTFD